MHRSVVMLFDVLIFLIVSVIAALLAFDQLGIKPAVNGFFCRDENLMYPYRLSSIPAELVAFLFVLMPFVLMTGIEAIRHYHFRPKDTGWNCTWYWDTCYKTAGVFLFGMSVTVLLGEITKLAVGRLRPHFLDVCKPDYNKTNCFSDNIPIYVDVGDQHCQGNEVSLLADARKSFPFIHAAMAFYAVVYLNIYLQVRLKWRKVMLLRPAIQALYIGLAIYIACSGVADHRHYWSDAVGGALLGATVAILTVCFVSTLLDKWIRQDKLCNMQRNTYYKEIAIENDNAKRVPLLVF
ncbi:hypothetical protein CHS0354_040561 [Potamilus streckersoni]|uniref:Phosphatidic acid phosphatase type 2/haloperoxidase domain-containing protein n=1 Tax=Potamilus streckersoni TaxID=2493646 RepID=A0AAE0SGK4_9BIVA|nr:hypothetical protein CHS0354_040561 [Potamilus streckersoni]